MQAEVVLNYGRANCSTVEVRRNPIVIDAHCHLMATARWPYQGGADKLSAKPLVDKMNASGVDVGISMGSGGNTLEWLRASNDFNLQASKDFPGRIVPMIYFDPRYEEDGIEEIDRCMQKGGFKGIKVGHEGAEARYMLPMMEKAQHYGIPVSIHSDHSVRSHPYLIADLANSFPKVTVVCLHMGLRTAAATELLGINAAEKNPNLWLETCFSHPYPIRMAVKRLGADRIMYGSDSSNDGFASGDGHERPEYEMMIQMDMVRCLNLPKEQEDKIMGLNAARLYGVVVKK